jgi:hypothetical protein
MIKQNSLLINISLVGTVSVYLYIVHLCWLPCPLIGGKYRTLEPGHDVALFCALFPPSAFYCCLFTNLDILSSSRQLSSKTTLYGKSCALQSHGSIYLGSPCWIVSSPSRSSILDRALSQDLPLQGKLLNYALNLPSINLYPVHTHTRCPTSRYTSL